MRRGKCGVAIASAVIALVLGCFEPDRELPLDEPQAPAGSAIGAAPDFAKPA